MFLVVKSFSTCLSFFQSLGRSPAGRAISRSLLANIWVGIAGAWNLIQCHDDFVWESKDLVVLLQTRFHGSLVTPNGSAFGIRDSLS